MSKFLRIILVVASVAVIAILAGAPVVWAGFAHGGNPAGASNVADPILNPWRRKPGSVKPPTSEILTIRTSGNFAVGGFCTFIVGSLSPNIIIEVEHSIIDALDLPWPDPGGIFLSPVCHVQYHDQFGNHLAGLQPGDGNIQICFAAIPDRIGDIFVDSKFFVPVWSDLPTTVDNVLACAPATESGFYVRRGN